MKIRMAGLTDVGKHRKSNQDSIFFDEVLGLAVVCDGIGGHKGGDVASLMAVNDLKQAYVDCERLGPEEISPFLSTTVDQINAKIYTRGQNDGALMGMGTTLNAQLFVGPKVYIAHLGDSRAYLYWQGQMWQLSLDHSVEVYANRGWISKEALAHAPKPSALVRALGLNPKCEIDIYEKTVRTGEIYLSCSDGLSGMVGEKRIAALLREFESSLSEAPQALIDEANKRGGRDNISVVLTQILST